MCKHIGVKDFQVRVCVSLEASPPHWWVNPIPQEPCSPWVGSGAVCAVILCLSSMVSSSLSLPPIVLEVWLVHIHPGIRLCSSTLVCLTRAKNCWLKCLHACSQRAQTEHQPCVSLQNSQYYPRQVKTRNLSALRSRYRVSLCHQQTTWGMWAAIPTLGTGKWWLGKGNCQETVFFPQCESSFKKSALL